MALTRGRLAARDGSATISGDCTLPLTGEACVDRTITDLTAEPVSCAISSARADRPPMMDQEEAVRDAAICEPLRTPVDGFGGSLRDVPVQDLAAPVIRAVTERTGLHPGSVDDVLLGHCCPTMEAPRWAG